MSNYTSLAVVGCGCSSATEELGKIVTIPIVSAYIMCVYMYVCMMLSILITFLSCVYVCEICEIHVPAYEVSLITCYDEKDPEVTSVGYHGRYV